MEYSQLPGSPISLWMDTAPATDYSALSASVEVDVAIVGGGLAGITTAFLLRQAGKSVAVIESRRIGMGATGHTTAKISALHEYIYTHVAGSFGKEGAALYAQANQAAVELIASHVQSGGIDCDFSRQPMHVFGASPNEVDKLRQEAEEARNAGLNATYVPSLDIPIRTVGAVRLDGQAQFHPRKYLLALASSLPGDSSHIFENTRVVGIQEGEPCVVSTARGEVRAKDVVVATQFPIDDKPGIYFARLRPERDYAYAVRLSGAVPAGMYISTAPDSFAVRSHRDWLIVSGESHLTGREENTIGCYRKLHDVTAATFPVAATDYRWSTQDDFTPDRVAYIGHLTSGSRHLYVATGFNGWGMTHSTISGKLISDLILGRDNPWKGLFDPSRFKPVASAKGFLSQNLSTAREIVGGRLERLPTRSVASLGLGEADVLDIGGEHVAVYKDQVGGVHAVSASCRHMGCTVTWNNAERTWDCPCHGSRYDFDGHVLNGPTVKDLEPGNVTATH